MPQKNAMNRKGEETHVSKKKMLLKMLSANEAAGAEFRGSFLDFGTVREGGGVGQKWPKLIHLAPQALDFGEGGSECQPGGGQESA